METVYTAPVPVRVAWVHNSHCLPYIRRSRWFFVYSDNCARALNNNIIWFGCCCCYRIVFGIVDVGWWAIGALRQKLLLCTGTINLNRSLVHQAHLHTRAPARSTAHNDNNAIAASTSGNWRLNDVFYSIELTTKHFIWSPELSISFARSLERQKATNEKNKMKKPNATQLKWISFVWGCCAHGCKMRVRCIQNTISLNVVFN